MDKNVVEFAATGRRKEAVARVRLVNGVGKIMVNKRDFTEYFPSIALQQFITKPFVVTDTENRYDVMVSIKGGGLSGQAGAMRHGISRALTQAHSDARAALKGEQMLTRDARMKERKKPGQPGARKRFQFSKR